MATPREAPAFDAIRARLPVYRDADAALAEDVLGHIRRHHDLLCAVLRRGRPAEARDFRFVARHAALRARRGVALPDFLEAFRCYHNVVWEAMTDAARDAGLDRTAGCVVAAALPTAPPEDDGALRRAANALAAAMRGRRGAAPL